MPVDKRQPSVLYVSYDGASEPLGRSQVVSYLRLLATTTDITLISFEKPGGAENPDTARLLSEAGVRWRPLPYHRKPPVLSTMWDVAAGVRAMHAELRMRPADIVHVRSYVPALIAMMGSLRRRPWRLLFDIRGFWVDERVEGGLWRRGGILHRIGKRCERWFFREADAVVTLTHASVPRLQAWTGGRAVPIEVIPTCAPVEEFAANAAGNGGGKTVWCGSIGGWYRFDLAVRLAGVLGRPFTVLTRQADEAAKYLDGTPADVREVAPEQVPNELAQGDIGLCLYGRDSSMIARAPTRLAEYLAAGMPVAVTPDIGDLDDIVHKHRVGVVIDAEDEASLASASQRLLELASDPDLPARARAIARERFTLEAGAAAYAQLYARMIAQP